MPRAPRRLSTASGINPLPQIPATLLTEGSPAVGPREPGSVWCTTTGSTAVVALYGGAVGSAIGSKTLIAASGTLSFATGAASWPAFFTYDGTFRGLSSTAGQIHGSGTYKSGHIAAGGGLAVALIEYPLPITLALRTVSTLNTSQNIELDIGITMSATTGTPSLLVTDLWADLSG